MVNWDCTGCWQAYEYEVNAAERRLEKTTVYQPGREADAFICSRCGALLEPYLDEI